MSCVTDGIVTICRTPMEEVVRESVGERWCFHCRRRHQFDYIVRQTIEPSWYEPNVSIEGAPCGVFDGDLFPGRSREWEYRA